MSVFSNGIVGQIEADVAIFLGIPILVGGVIGGILNIVVFLSLTTFRKNSCAFFLTIMSFVNIGQLLFSLLSRIMINGFRANWTDESVVYCKFRNYCLQVCALTSYTCMCAATIDQFLSTSLRVHWQQYINLKKAYVLCALSFIISLIHSIPTLIWYDLVLSPATETIFCSVTNPGFYNYITYVYVLILTGVLPISITIFFGSLAYCNVRKIPYRIVPLVRRELDKQLTSIVLAQVVCNIFIILPYVICLFLLYTYNSNNSLITISSLNTGYNICLIIYYLYFACPFYIYVCVSKRFRQQFIYVITKWKTHENAINPVSSEER